MSINTGSWELELELLRAAISQTIEQNEYKVQTGNGNPFKLNPELADA